MRIGQLHLITGPDTQVAVAEKYSHISQMLEESNGDGYEVVWFTEHHHSNYSYTGNPLILLTKAASIALDMRLGTGVLLLPLWHPLRLAEDIATLDLLSGAAWTEASAEVLNPLSSKRSAWIFRAIVGSSTKDQTYGGRLDEGRFS